MTEYLIEQIQDKKCDWIYMSQMAPVLALAALFHDWGKANDAFQKKLKSGVKTGDSFRHEWISCRLIASLIASCDYSDDDRNWLSSIAEWEPEKTAKSTTLDISDKHTLGGLPPIASAICWLIVSHHRQPYLSKENAKKYSNASVGTFAEIMTEIKGSWGYARENGIQTIKFNSGLLENSPAWRNQIRKWAQEALAEHDNIVKMLCSNAFRSAICYMRLSLMMADYYISSQPAQEDWAGNTKLYANTEKGKKKQKLDEHLTGVAEQAMKILYRLPQIANRMESAKDVQTLKKKSPPRFAWQDTVAIKITEIKKTNEYKTDEGGWFVVNMASTGCGKTIANAKIMRAISPDGDGLRYVLALGLRSLTLQTGDEYRERLGLSGDELAVLIGDTAVRDLHMAEAEEKFIEDEVDTEKCEALLDGDLNYLIDSDNEFLDILFRQPSTAKKNKAFLYKPVVVATIDHIVAATETTRGGKYMIPFLRLMTSDLVIDEVDDFSPDDLWAVARLVHLSGMLGRNVTISSATIPPDLSEALFYAYQKGRGVFDDYFGRRTAITCVWCDEYGAEVTLFEGNDAAGRSHRFHELHQSFVKERVGHIGNQIVKRRASIVNCRPSEGRETKEKQSARECYFAQIQKAAITLHEAHHVVDAISGKRISFGVIRIANIDPCVAISQYLLSCDWNEGYDIRLMTYHSRQTQLLRHNQERCLDKVLKRNENWQKNILEQDSDLRRHIDASFAKNLLFIVVATPVEELGRDHDFDWAVIEPSSYRSIIQMAGRILRHRIIKGNIEYPNIAVMQYNLLGIQNASRAFCRPGYETGGKYVLASHDLNTLVNENELMAGIDSAPRIQKPFALSPRERLIDLEHQVMQDFNDIERKGLASLHGYIDECWWLTGLPQSLRRFREGRPDLELYYCYGDNETGKLDFYEKSQEGNFNRITNSYHIERQSPITNDAELRLWLKKDYEDALRLQGKKELGVLPDAADIARLAKKYGRITIPVEFVTSGQTLVYSDVFGIYRKQQGA